jgi:hypothetical protein
LHESGCEEHDMARRPLTTAFGRVIGATLTAGGFREEPGLRWWERSALGDFAVVEVQRSRDLSGLENCFVNVAAVPGPWYAWMKWIDPAEDVGEAPGASSAIWFSRVQPRGSGWLT